MFVDHYEWLRDKSDPKVIAHRRAENRYTEAMTEHLEPLRRQIFEEIKARTKETDLSVPIRRGEYWYYARSFEGKQYGVHCRCRVADPDDWSPPVLDEHTDIEGEGVARTRNVGRGTVLRPGAASSVSKERQRARHSRWTPSATSGTLRFQGLTNRRTGRRRDRGASRPEPPGAPTT